MKNIKNKVSVCIPVYNGENFIKESIKSVLTQSHKQYELLILDNNSTDKTIEIVKKFKDKRIRIIKNDKNIGSINNFNKCILEAKNSFIVILPHDDLLLKDFLKKGIEAMSNPEIGFVYSAFNIVDKYNTILSNKLTDEKTRSLSSNETINVLLKKSFPIQLAFCRTKILKDIGGFKSDYGPFCDAVLYSEIAFKNWSSFFYAETHFCHRSHSEQGQNAFISQDLDILSMHWGKKLDRSFFIKNNNNLLLLKYIKNLDFNIKLLSMKCNLKNSNLFKLLVRKNLKMIFKGLCSLHIFNLKIEFKLLFAIFSMFGIFNLLSVCIVIIYTELKKRI